MLKQKEDIKVAVIGTGNVGTQFARIFDTQPIPPRTLDGLPLDADLYIICVCDSAVKGVAEKMPSVPGIVVHTTGSVPMDVLARDNISGYGVMYPFQTISKARPLPPSSIPLLIEGNTYQTEVELFHVARTFGFSNIALADSEKRRRVHLCGTFACNFTNAMIGISQKILSESGIDVGIINPLVEETVEKLKTLPAKDAQTGPAVRKDRHTLYLHKCLLKEIGMGEELDIYEIISDYIMDKI